MYITHTLYSLCNDNEFNCLLLFPFLRKIEYLIYAKVLKIQKERGRGRYKINAEDAVNITRDVS